MLQLHNNLSMFNGLTYYMKCGVYGFMDMIVTLQIFYY
jgi:hypothetical protein